MSAPPLRIAMISRRVHPAHGPGGMEKHVHDLVRHLAAAGTRVDLFAETPDESRRAAAEAAFDERVRLHWVPPGPLPIGRRRGTVVLDRITNYPLWSRKVAQRLHGEYDVIHANGLGGLGVGEDRARGRRDTPLVLVPHGIEEFYAHQRLKYLAYAPFRAWIRRTVRAADRIVIMDEALVPMAVHALHLTPERFAVIPNAMDPEQCTGAADREQASRVLGADAGASPLLVSIGRIEANKGFVTLARALGRVRDRLPNGWRWVLVGEGPGRGALEAAVLEAGIAGNCRLLGRVDDPVKHGLLAQADWFVHPTLFEGSSLVTLEAMAHALPVLGTRAGGIPDKVQEGRTGFLVAPGDEEDLAQGLLRAVSADGPTLGRAGRVLLGERFAWEPVTQSYLDLYQELRKRHGRVR